MFSKNANSLLTSNSGNEISVQTYLISGITNKSMQIQILHFQQTTFIQVCRLSLLLWALSRCSIICGIKSLPSRAHAAKCISFNEVEIDIDGILMNTIHSSTKSILKCSCCIRICRLLLHWRQPDAAKLYEYGARVNNFGNYGNFLQVGMHALISRAYNNL